MTENIESNKRTPDYRVELSNGQWHFLTDAEAVEFSQCLLDAKKAMCEKLDLPITVETSEELDKELIGPLLRIWWGGHGHRRYPPEDETFVKMEQVVPEVEVLHPKRAMLAGIDEEILCWDGDGFDEAIIGVGYRFNEGPVAVYSYRGLIDALMADGTSEEDAIEHYEFNIIGGWIGEKTPMVVELFEDMEVIFWG